MAFPEDAGELLLFRVSGQRFALPTRVVREVVFAVEPEPVPGWPDEALGLIDVRGVLMPLVDVGPSLGRAPVPLSPSQFIVLVEVNGKPLGVLSDDVEGVTDSRVPEAAAIPATEMLGQPRACLGIINVGGRVMVLDPEALVQGLRVPTPPPAQPGVGVGGGQRP